MKGFLFGLVIGLLIIPVAGYCYFRFGYAPVATAAPPMMMEHRIAHMALEARIEKEAPKQAPIQASEENLMSGAKLYQENCAVCHGMKSGDKTPTAKGMYPAPPRLLTGKGVTDDPPGESYWKISNGIRLTGMPAYNQSLNETQIWQIALLVATADKLPANVNAYLNSLAASK